MIAASSGASAPVAAVPAEPGAGAAVPETAQHETATTRTATRRTPEKYRRIVRTLEV
jgi:hypothetical protein